MDNGTAIRVNGTKPGRDVRVAIVGSGFSGLGAAIRLRQEGEDNFLVFERADEVGGTWRQNTYPGCACDIQSHLYSYSFAPNPSWTHSFGWQKQILEYLRDCADRFGVRPHLRFGHEVLNAQWDDDSERWRIETNQGVYTAQVFVSAMGYLSEPSIPSLPGLSSFEGKTFHSSRWDHDHDLSGQRVAVIGTGASTVQFLPKIQPEVGTLNLFQRTPPWVGPRGHKPINRLQGWMLRNIPHYQQLRRNVNYRSREVLVWAMAHPKLMGKMQNMASGHLQKSVPDEKLRARLTPDYTMGCKRILFSDDYYPALQQPNVEVVTDGIREVRSNSIVTVDGQEREVDTIIFGTGFRATSPPVANRVWGRGGLKLADAWSDGMSAYLGTTIAGFPNMFMLLGPNTGLAHSSMVLMIEAQITYVLDCLRQMDKGDLSSVEVRSEIQHKFNDMLQNRMAGAVWNAGGCKSWYLDGNGRNSVIWPTYTWRFRRMTQRFDLESYLARGRVHGVRPEVHQPA